MTRIYQTPKILHDAPLRDQKAADFHFDDFAATLARLVASAETETPLTIGVNGAWGSGKTSLLYCVKDMLDQPKGKDKKEKHRFADGEEKDFRACKTVWFDAWKYNEEKELLVALVRVILHAMHNDGFISRLKKWFEDPLQPSYDVAAMFVNAFQATFGGLGAEFKIQLNPDKYKEPSPFTQHTAFFDYFNDAFKRLIALWIHNTNDFSKVEDTKGVLVIFIDDLDRCLPEKTVQALEALKLFLDTHDCVFLLGADTNIVQRAVETHYRSLGIMDGSARDYLEKIIQLRFDLPPIVETSMENFLKAQDKTKVDAAMLTRWQALIAAAEVNPRRVKNVINDLNLQWFMALNSGQAQGVNRDDFICWQALMRAAPPKFIKRVVEFEDKAIRYSFVLDALKWQTGKQEDRDAVEGNFGDYKDDDSRRLRKVLKQISFSEDFNPVTLDSMIYMAAPPAKPEPEKPVVEEPQKTAESELAGGEVFAEAKEVMRGERGKGTMPHDGNRLAIGGLEFARVLQSKFVMGSKEESEWPYNQEKPQHTVAITYDYWMSKFILTNGQYAEFLAKQKHPVSDWQKKKDHPVVNVSWEDAAAYCKWFNETHQEELKDAGNLTLRLPTEAEWEKAARGAYGNEWPWGNEFDAAKCNSREGGKGGTTPVGLYSASGGDSPYGCADMVGNVWEWCSDWFDEAEYKKRASGSVVDPRGPQSGTSRVLRGGSFLSDRSFARCAFRSRNLPLNRYYSLGFRVCLSSPSHI